MAIGAMGDGERETAKKKRSQKRDRLLPCVTQPLVAAVAVAAIRRERRIECYIIGVVCLQSTGVSTC